VPTKKIEDIEFQRFYSAYPSKKARGAAEKSWQKLIEGMDDKEKKDFATTLVLAIDSQKKEKKRKRDHGDFVPEWPMPSTWLNQQRWLDEVKTNFDFEREKAEIKDKCGKCGKAYNGPGTLFQNKNLFLCNGCYPDTQRINKKGYARMKKMGYALEDFKTREEWIEATKQFCFSHGYEGTA